VLLSVQDLTLVYRLITPTEVSEYKNKQKKKRGGKL
jgi:hypothetical protein